MKLNGRDVAAAYTMRPEQKSQGVPPNWLVYIAVDDADAMAAKAASLGATVLMPAFDVMEHGRMAVIQDPQGAVFAIWQAKTHAGTGISGVNTVSWADLNTTDQVGAEKFYSSLFGWKMLGRRPQSDQAWRLLPHHERRADDRRRSALRPARPERTAALDDLLRRERLRGDGQESHSLGAQTYVDTMQIGDSGSMAVLADPQGAVFALHQAK